MVRGLAVGLAVAVVAAFAPVASSATIEVDIKTDFSDTDDGDCALREAIRSANETASVGDCTAGTAGPNTIRVPAGKYTLTIDGEDNGSELGDVDISGDTTIVGLGNGAVIDGGGDEGILDRLIDLRAGSLVMRNVTVQNGRSGDDGGGIRTAAGIPMTLADVQILDNRASGGGVNSGGISADGPLTISDSLVARNGAPFNGGISARDGLTMRRTTLVGNSAAFGAGGLFSSDPATITDSTFTENELDSETGTQNGAGADFTDDATLRNVTVSGNFAFQGGGGLAVVNNAGVTLVNVTVASNTADLNEDNTNPGDGGGLFSDGGGMFRLRNTVVADNLDMTPLGDGDIEPDCSAQVVSLGNNLIENQVGCAIITAVGSPADLGEGTAPRLFPLAFNGGPTQTMAIRKGSPLRNKISKATCNGGTASPAKVTTDQRRVPRPQSGRCDTGAYEYATCGKRLVKDVGSSARDRLAGTGAKDGILGLGGKDRLRGKGGADGLCGNGGKDKLTGQGGNDRLLGAGGRDRLNGGGGRDILKGGPGKDICIGGPGKDKAVGCEVERSI